MIDLGEDHRVITVYCVGNLSVAFDGFSAVTVDHLLIRPVGWMGREFLGNDQSYSTLCASLVVRHVPVGREAILCKISEVGAENYPVLDHLGPKGDLFEGVGVGVYQVATISTSALE